MATAPTEHRLTAVEQALLELAQAHTRTEAAHALTEANLDRLATEARESKAEARRFNAERKASADRIDRQLAALAERVDKTTHAIEALGERVDKTSRVVEETSRQARNTTRQMGELSNKMGTLAEDLVAPGIPEIFRRLFGQDLKPNCSVRVRRYHPEDAGRSQEYDVVAFADDVLLINETRSKLGAEEVKGFIDKFEKAREYLPEARDRKIVGALASFYVDPSLVKHVERAGLLMLGLGSGLMEILNTPDFKPREF